MSTALDHRYCTFLLGGVHFGVPVTKVQEVLRAQERTRIPLVSPVVDGLINLRGEIVTTLDLRRRLGLPPRGDDAEAMNVVIRSDEGVVSLLVDEIRDVLEVEDADFEPVPPTLTGPWRDLVTAIFKLDDSLLLILDTERLLEIRDTTDQREVHHA
jgi:purine-binding chemotaxis protein CheW